MVALHVLSFFVALTAKGDREGFCVDYEKNAMLAFQARAIRIDCGVACNLADHRGANGSAWRALFMLGHQLV